MSLDGTDSLIDRPLEIIPTRSVALVETGIKLGMMMPEPTIILITGKAGIGKSKSIEYFVLPLQPRAHTGLRACEIGVVPHNPTRLSLPRSILEQLGERPRGRTSAQLIGQTIEVLRDNELQLLILDEGDRLNDDSFEVLKDLHDAAVRRVMNCRLAIVGLPDILDLIKKHEQFDSRAAINIEVVPLDEAEIIHVFLPKLNLPRWRFDPANRIDQELGKLLWRHTQPSLRRLVSWISAAAGLAEMKEEAWITLDEIEEAAELVRFGPKQPPEFELAKGIHERVSELRNAYKALKKTGK